jgi:hypothetical protein
MTRIIICDIQEILLQRHSCRQGLRSTQGTDEKYTQISTGDLEENGPFGESKHQGEFDIKNLLNKE